MPFRFRENTKTKRLMELVLYTGGFKHRDLNLLTDNALTIEEARKAQAKYQQAERRLREAGYLRKDVIRKMWIVRKKNSPCADKMPESFICLLEGYDKATDKWWLKNDRRTSINRAHRLTRTILFFSDFIPMLPNEKPAMGSRSGKKGNYFYTPKEIYECGDWTRAGSGNIAWSRFTGIISRKAVYVISSRDDAIPMAQENKSSSLINAALNETLDFSTELSLEEGIILTLDDKVIEKYIKDEDDSLLDVFKKTYAIPMTFEGQKFCRVFLNNPNTLKGLVDLPGEKSASTEADAVLDDGTLVLEWFVPDMNRLRRFMYSAKAAETKSIILCFDFQAESLKFLRNTEIRSFPFDDIYKEVHGSIMKNLKLQH